MKKNFKSYIFSLLLFISIVFGNAGYANTMESIDYSIVLNQDGSGEITELRKMNMDRDTEIYIVIDNLRGSEVTEFSVSDFGTPLEYEPNWDIEASREEKAGKYGIIETSDGVELAWGIGDYGYHEYTVSYTITGVVRQLEDGQAMNWQFFDGSGNINPQEMTINVSGPVGFNQENTRIWGFGFEGQVNLEDGNLIGSSSSPLNDDNYITILMQFLNSPFEPALSLDQTLAEQEELAMEGSSFNSGSGQIPKVFIILAAVGGILMATVMGSSIAGMFLLNKEIKKANPLKSSRKLRQENKDMYYRDVPYSEGPITDIAYMLNHIERGKLEDYFGAFMIKWMSEGRIRHLTEEKGFIFKKDSSVIQLMESGSYPPQDDLESRLWEMMKSASGEDSQLEEKEFSKWAKKNYKQIESFNKDLTIYSKKKLEEKEYITSQKVAAMKVFKKEVTSSTEKGDDLLNHLVQFENYLDDFSLLSERELNEAKLWKELLVWASLYGLSEKVAKQLEKLYPQYAEEYNITYADIYMMHLFTTSFSRGYQSGLSAASGGGGATSLGGGGGSFGGGGGGSR